jgi:hypothetical protein
MARSQKSAMDRRMTLGGVLAGAGGLALPHLQSRTVTQRGIVGGGQVRVEDREAQFSVFASRLIFDADTPEVVVGRVLWVEAARGVTMRSTQVVMYRVVEMPSDHGQGRELFGTMRVTGEASYPFYLLLIDGGPAGSGQDTVSLTVGDGARQADSVTPVWGLGFSYAVAGPVVTGDVQVINLEIDPVAGVSRPAPPPR